jgi:hypothetical protein
MKKIFFCLVVLFCYSIKTYAQTDCDPTAEVSSPDYCFPIPVDENVVFLVVAGLAIGIWKLRSSKQLSPKSLQ